MVKSRRKARIAAVQTLYSLDITKGSLTQAILDLKQEGSLTSDQFIYAEKLIRGVYFIHKDIDDQLEACVQGYNYDRLATVDRNVLRVAAWEILHEPSIPPAVSIDEAIEISRKFSMPESGKFVNGILGKLLQSSPKANWNPDKAPAEEFEEPEEDEPMEIVEETLDIESEEAKKLARIGGWKLRSTEENS